MAKSKSQHRKDSRNAQVEGAEYEDVVAELEQATDEVESEKERRKFEREERKFLKEHQKKSKQQERWVAPVLLILTVVISYFVFIFTH
jgi:hypothetical protein